MGKPDIVFPSKCVVVFLDSCFFHKCPYHYVQPKSNKQYWLPKIKRNTIRAKEVNKQLRKEGWKVIRIWEHSVKKNPEEIAAKIIKVLKTNS